MQLQLLHLTTHELRQVIRCAQSRTQDLETELWTPSAKEAFPKRTRDPMRTHLLDLIKELQAPALAELMSLMWLGRGTASERVKDWEYLVLKAASELDEGSASYIAGKEPLANYLLAGLAKLRGAVNRGPAAA